MFREGAAVKPTGARVFIRHIVTLMRARRYFIGIEMLSACHICPYSSFSSVYIGCLKVVRDELRRPYPITGP